MNENEEPLSVEVKFKPELPWWDPENERWWETPICVPVNLYYTSRWALTLL